MKDRITSLLQNQTMRGMQAPQGLGMGDIVQSYLSSLSTGTGAAGFGDSYNKLQQIRQQQQKNLHDMMQDEIKRGNEDAAYVDKAIRDVAGDDTQAYEKIASELHNMPDPVDRSNATLSVSKAANKLGLKSFSQSRSNLEMEGLRGKINLQNAQANYYNQRGQGVAGGGRPMPATVVKLQNEELDTIGTVGGINADLSTLYDQLETGDLELGPVRNIKSGIQNAVGKSTKVSRNYDSFKGTLEKLRNDSLRLNKGVQTEGDSQRAWNELLKNINDPKLVKERIAEIIEINQRASDLKKMNVDQIRANYGNDPLDYTRYENRSSAIGAKSAGSGKKRLAFNPETGEVE